MPKGRAVSPEQRAEYLVRRQNAEDQSSAAVACGVSRTWAWGFERGLSPEVRASIPSPTAGRRSEVPRAAEGLCGAARGSLDDFELFRRRFFGRVSTPWQIEAGVLFADLLASDRKEFVVVNCPPGAGKSALLHDVQAWLIARDRSVRLLLGSRTERQAVGYSSRLKRTLERRTPERAKDLDVRLGTATDAEGCLAVDFGAFRPPASGDIWRREQFTVVQPGETPTDEKESTVTAFGMDSGQLGWRVNGVFWDDLVDRSTVRTEEGRDAQVQWYEDEAETRLEPAGLLVLCGQRIASNDLYRHVLDMPAADVVELDMGDDEEFDSSTLPRKYTHIVYKAHDEGRCERLHKPGEALAWPEGCLLDPVRVPWRELRAIRAGRERKYRVLYQQEDVDPASVLVPPLWVSGGVDPVTKELLPGCWDKDRRLGELPKDLARPLVSVATADPSPTKYWGIEWWIYQPDTGLRYLMDLERRSMSAPSFLDWNEATGAFSGVMEDWYWKSQEVGCPISTWIVEANAAQRFILQFDHFRRWQRARGVKVIAHQTSRNKADAELGVEAALQPVWRRGLVRLPGSQDGTTRTASMKLVDEVTKYPDGGTTDCLMAQWFLEYNIGQLRAPDRSDEPEPSRPRFLRRRMGAAA